MLSRKKRENPIQGDDLKENRDDWMGEYYLGR